MVSVGFITMGCAEAELVGWEHGQTKSESRGGTEQAGGTGRTGFSP